jgi:hypothetical protein
MENHSKTIGLNISKEFKTLMSYSLFPVLKNMKIKKELEKQWNEIE